VVLDVELSRIPDPALRGPRVALADVNAAVEVTLDRLAQQLASAPVATKSPRKANKPSKSRHPSARLAKKKAARQNSEVL
jgi:hypothetical protein